LLLGVALAQTTHARADMSIIMDYFAGTKYKKSFQDTGDTQDSVWSCGQVIGLIHDVPTCKVLVERIVREAVDTIQGRLAKMIVPGQKPSSRL